MKIFLKDFVEEQTQSYLFQIQSRRFSCRAKFLQASIRFSHILYQFLCGVLSKIILVLQDCLRVIFIFLCFQMAPKREFLDKVNYLERSVCDDFLEQLTFSTNQASKAKELVPRAPRLKIGEGLYDKGNWLRDPQVGLSGLGLFKVGFGMRNSPAPQNSIWELDVGKLVVLVVFMDTDLLTQMALNYDPVTRCIRDINGKTLVEINAEEFRTTFGLNEFTNFLEPINFTSLAQVYSAQRIHLRNGPLKELFLKIGGLAVVGPNTQEPFSLSMFTLRAKGMYWALCQVLREDAEANMPNHYLLMIVQILNPSLAITFDYASFIADAIHGGLIGIKNGKVDRPFGWYSLLMHLFLFKGGDYFASGLDLVKEKEGEKMPVQLWSNVLSWDREDASFLKFDKYFASKIRTLLCSNNPRVPKVLLEFIRPKEFAENIKIVHNWGDMYLYLVSMVFRVFGFRGTPFLLPYQAPLKVGIVEILR